MVRLAFAMGAIGLAVAAGLFAGDARAQLSPESVEFAAHEHDLGYRAYSAKSFDEAATHFENAFFAAPNPAELRSAIRARREAGQPARAATLSALGKRKFPADAALAKIADETIAALRGKIHDVKLTSPEECQVTVDGKVVVAERSKELRFFVDPGKHELSVGWSDDRVLHQALDATAGGVQSLDLSPPPRPPPPAPVAGPVPEATPAEGTPTPSSGKPLPPVAFWAGVALTAVGAGVTTWSGIDTLDNPGTAAVKADCVGQGTGCAEYQKGLAAQTRTNVLIASTAVVGAATAVIGVFFTDWSGGKAASGSTGLTVRPIVGLGGAGVEGSF